MVFCSDSSQSQHKKKLLITTKWNRTRQLNESQIFFSQESQKESSIKTETSSGEISIPSGIRIKGLLKISVGRLLHDAIPEILSEKTCGWILGGTSIGNSKGTPGGFSGGNPGGISKETLRKLQKSFLTQKKSPKKSRWTSGITGCGIVGMKFWRNWGQDL